MKSSGRQNKLHVIFVSSIFWLIKWNSNRTLLSNAKSWEQKSWENEKKMLNRHGKQTLLMVHSSWKSEDMLTYYSDWRSIKIHHWHTLSNLLISKYWFIVSLNDRVHIWLTRIFFFCFLISVPIIANDMIVIMYYYMYLIHIKSLTHCSLSLLRSS